MKKQFTLMLLVLIIAPLNLWGGELSIYGGINHSWLYYPEVSALENEFNPNYRIGINYYHSIFSKTKISCGLNYFSIGRYDEINFNNIVETVTMHHSYLSVPIKIEYKLFDIISPFINIEPGIQINSKYKHTSSFSLNEEGNITDEMEKFNLFVGFGIKYDFVIAEQNFSISSLMNLGLFRISKDNYFDNSSRSWSDWRGREIVIGIEYRIGI